MRNGDLGTERMETQNSEHIEERNEGRHADSQSPNYSTTKKNSDGLLLFEMRAAHPHITCLKVTPRHLPASPHSAVGVGPNGAVYRILVLPFLADPFRTDIIGNNGVRVSARSTNTFNSNSRSGDRRSAECDEKNRQQEERHLHCVSTVGGGGVDELGGCDGLVMSDDAAMRGRAEMREVSCELRVSTNYIL